METFKPELFKPGNPMSSRELIFNGPGTEGKKLPSVKRHRAFLAPDAWLVGFKDQPGCFSFREVGDKVDVAIYIDAIPNKLTEEDLYDPHFVILDIYPGWGFEALKHLKEEMA